MKLIRILTGVFGVLLLLSIPVYVYANLAKHYYDVTTSDKGAEMLTVESNVFVSNERGCELQVLYRGRRGVYKEKIVRPFACFSDESDDAFKSWLIGTRHKFFYLKKDWKTYRSEHELEAFIKAWKRNPLPEYVGSATFTIISAFVMLLCSVYILHSKFCRTVQEDDEDTTEETECTDTSESESV